MSPVVVETDDEITRFASVYLGPPGKTLPFHVRYTAYLLGLVIFTSIILIEALLPVVSVGAPPSWELAITMVTTAGIMYAVDYDKPPAEVIRNLVTVTRIRRHPAPVPTATTPSLSGIKITRDPVV